MQQAFAEAHESTSFILGTIDQSTQLCPPHCCSTHGARLEGYVKGALVEIFSSKCIGSCGDGEHFGMGGYIVEQFGLVVCPGYDLIATHHDGAHWYLTSFECQSGLF